MDRRRNSPFVVTKLKQLWRLVRESHANPLTGSPRPVKLLSPEDLGITFIGHSSFLLQMDGRKILIDPVFAKRLLLLRRQKRAGLRVEELPAIDIVLLTHAHMDHLNTSSLRNIIRATRHLTGKSPEVIVPRGVEDLVARLGFAHIHTLEWWEEITLQNLRITMTPCQHWGARMFKDTHRGYGGYVIHSTSHAVYHSGDTAYFDSFHEIAHKLHPDIALLPIGAYFPDNYRAVHMSPEEALRAFVELSAQHMIPMHFGTFMLGREPMDEPVQRLLAESDRLKIRNQINVLEEGETMHLCSAARIR